MDRIDDDGGDSVVVVVVVGVVVADEEEDVVVKTPICSADNRGVNSKTTSLPKDKVAVREA